MEYKTFKDLPSIRPATADPRNFHDSLMERTHQTAEESARLDGILANYQRSLEAEIVEMEKGASQSEEGVVNI